MFEACSPYQNANPAHSVIWPELNVSDKSVFQITENGTEKFANGQGKHREFDDKI